MSMAELIAWIKIYRRIWLTHAQRSGGDHLFRFVLDVTVNNAYWIYCQSNLNPGEYRSDAFGFHRAIVDAYYRPYRKILLSLTLFTGSLTSPYKQFSTVFSYPVTYAFQSKSTLYSCLNVKELLAQSSREISRLSDCNWTWTHIHLVHNRTLSHLVKLV